jgi:hypothetical protein
MHARSEWIAPRGGEGERVARGRKGFTRVSLAAIRSTIIKRRRARFSHERRTEVRADLYLLGNARTTSAYVVVAWCIDPAWGWRVLRFSEIRDFHTIGQMDALREDFDPCRREITEIDTQILSPSSVRRR